MITAGIDMGAKTIKVVILKDGQVVGRSNVFSGFETRESADEAMKAACKEAGVTLADIGKIVATGAGRKDAPYATDDITEVGADAKGIFFLYPSVRTLIDVGAEEGRGIKCSAEGKVIDFVVNEKCAAGAGSFTESMARALEVSLEDFGKISLTSDKLIPMNAQCAVFAESEVVSLIHAKTPKADIAKSVHDAIASRIISMVRRIGIEKDVALIGGVAFNVGFVDALGRGLETDVIIPEHPDFVGALGAALSAVERSR
ncbi:MAG: acyl-CoA dehydratase activase [Dehalococcoidia bacterium]|nr:acyl-CoA dehydratase activase [Dehalococcoidia bacterium]